MTPPSARHRERGSKDGAFGMKIVHLTSVHQRFDTRIFLKECRSLAAHGHEVTLVVADGLGDTIRDQVRIIDAGQSANRLARMLNASRRVIARALELDPDIFHLHDPELLPGALALKRNGKKVIYDAHEDLQRQVLSKPYLPAPLRPAVSAVVDALEGHLSRRLGGVIAATPSIARRFRRIGVDCVEVNNFPILNELAPVEANWETKKREVSYIGGLSTIRGIGTLVRAADILTSDVRINIAGTLSDTALERDLRSLRGWERVNPLGFLNRQGVRRTLARSMAGIVTFLPLPNHISSRPNKMFEYMSAGIPVIASDFPTWREIVEGTECGICVDPLDPQQIAAAIDRLVNSPREAQRMGENGRKAVMDLYNWTVEERELIGLYETLV